MVRKELLEKFIKILNEKYSLNIIGGNIKEVSYTNYMYVRSGLFRELAEDSITTIDIKNFLGAFGFIRLDKLDSFVYNKLLLKGYGFELHNMSLADKLKIYLTKEEYKIFYRGFIRP